MQALARGIAANALPDYLRRGIGSVPLRAGCVECNDDQIAALCGELHEDYGFATDGLDVDALLAMPDPCTALRRFDLLVTTPFHAGEVQSLAARCGTAWLAVSPRSDLYADIARRIAKEPVYFIVTDRRFAEKLRKMYAPMTGAENFRALTLGRDDVASVPLAATYVTIAARERLKDSPLLAQAMPEARIFSSGSAREILQFIVSRNLAVVAER
jgi:hypothetical protein